MKVLIEIDEEDLERIKARTGKSSSDYIILNGKPLPKGHGRLIDADALKHTLNFYMRQWDGEYDYAEGRYDSYEVAIDELNDADTIIGADKVESEDK